VAGGKPARSRAEVTVVVDERKVRHPPPAGSPTRRSRNGSAAERPSRPVCVITLWTRTGRLCTEDGLGNIVACRGGRNPSSIRCHSPWRLQRLGPQEGGIRKRRWNVLFGRRHLRGALAIQLLRLGDSCCHHRLHLASSNVHGRPSSRSITSVSGLSSCRSAGWPRYLFPHPRRKLAAAPATTVHGPPMSAVPQELVTVRVKVSWASAEGESWHGVGAPRKKHLVDVGRSATALDRSAGGDIHPPVAHRRLDAVASDGHGGQAPPAPPR
jgi:hypothetical protein